MSHVNQRARGIRTGKWKHRENPPGGDCQGASPGAGPEPGWALCAPSLSSWRPGGQEARPALAGGEAGDEGVQPELRPTEPETWQRPGGFLF